MGSKWSNDQADSNSSMPSAACHMASTASHVVFSGAVLRAKRIGPSCPAGCTRAGRLCHRRAAMDTPAYDTYDERLAEVMKGPDGGLAEGLSAYLGMRMVHVGPGVAVVEV